MSDENKAEPGPGFKVAVTPGATQEQREAAAAVADVLRKVLGAEVPIVPLSDHLEPWRKSFEENSTVPDSGFVRCSHCDAMLRQMYDVVGVICHRISMKCPTCDKSVCRHCSERCPSD